MRSALELFLVPQRVFETQIEKDAVVALAGTGSHDKPHAGHNLQAALEVVRPADAGNEPEGLCRHGGMSARNHLTGSPLRLKQRIEALMSKPDEALPRRIIP